LTVLDEHQSRFPRGALVAEREAARVLTLCDAGQQTRAKKIADRFLRLYPRSPLNASVRASCASAPVVE
jgi:hypothetical protein